MNHYPEYSLKENTMIPFVKHTYKMKMVELFHTIMYVMGTTLRLPGKWESGDAPQHL